MGIFYSKKNIASRPSLSKAKENAVIQLDSIPARVDRIHIDGLERTKDDIIIYSINELFQSKNFADILYNATQVKNNLDNLECFKNIGIYLDTSKGPKASPNGVDVTFFVKEYKRVLGGISTSINNNSEGQVTVALRTPNIFGRGEKIQFEYTYGSSNSNNIGLGFVKPLIKIPNGQLRFNIFQNHADWISSGFRQLDRGANLNFQFNSFYPLKHNILLEGVIRDISPLSKNTSFKVREQSGPTFKTSIKHQLIADWRDQKIFPTNGCFAQLNSELTGAFGGDIKFIKNDLALQWNYLLVDDVVLQYGFQCGHLYNLDKVTICDKFFLGGPLSLRGFYYRGVGPHEDGYALGSNVFWAGALHLYTPLPFRIGKGGFGDFFRTHFFMNWGNCGNFDLNKSLDSSIHQLTELVRVAYGFGLALRIGDSARIELNYCVPLKYERIDLINSSGIQFGVGVDFL